MGSSLDIGINDQQRQQMFEGLSRVLADTYVLTARPTASTGTSPDQCSIRST